MKQPAKDAAMMSAFRAWPAVVKTALLRCFYPGMRRTLAAKLRSVWREKMNQPLVLVGHTRKRSFVGELKARGWGRMMVFDNPRPFDGEPWGFDNGAFYFWIHGQEFDSDLYRKNLERAYAIKERPYMAIIPDKVARGTESLEYSLQWYARELPQDWPWYLAVQDGMDEGEVGDILRQTNIAGLFLGGTDRFKERTAWMWAARAKDEAKKFHYGRAGTIRKLMHARRVDSDSLDSAFPIWTEERFKRFIRQWEFSCGQQSLPIFA
jgi:hypothetical protein